MPFNHICKLKPKREWKELRIGRLGKLPVDLPVIRFIIGELLGQISKLTLSCGMFYAPKFRMPSGGVTDSIFHQRRKPNGLNPLATPQINI